PDFVQSGVLQTLRLLNFPQPLLNFEWFDCQRGLAAEARNHSLVQNPLVSLRRCIGLLDGCLGLVFLQLVLYVMLTELPISGRIPPEGLILVSVCPETLPIHFLPRIFLARADISHETNCCLVFDSLPIRSRYLKAIDPRWTIRSLLDTNRAILIPGHQILLFVGSGGCRTEFSAEQR